ncbi:MAG TPA: hypothetical protein VMW95_08990, partial [Desulfobacterales bacterium]|nr:hypothetical protein [Desulfobacterales bacterium]
ILGVTVNTYKDMQKIDFNFLRNLNNKLLISVEPIQNTFGYYFFEIIYKAFDWIHVGQESGNRKNKIKATPEMIKPFYNSHLPVFMKENIRGICSSSLRKEFPI